MTKSRLQGNILLFITALIWGAAFVAQKIGVVQVGSFTLTSVRFFISGVALLPFAAFRIRNRKLKATHTGEPSALKTGERKALILGGVICGLCLMFATVTQQYGLTYTTAGKAGFITALYILFVPIFRFFGGRKAPFTVWISVLAALVGLYLLCVKEGLSVNAGDLYVLLCALLFTIHILVVDRFSPHVDGVVMSCIQFFVASLTAAIPMLIIEKPAITAILACWAPLLYLGIISGGIGYTLQILGQQRTDPTVASLIMSLESVFAAISGGIFLSESFTGREIVGCALVFTATLVSQVDFRQLRQRKASMAEDSESNLNAS